MHYRDHGRLLSEYIALLLLDRSWGTMLGDSILANCSATNGWINLNFARNPLVHAAEITRPKMSAFTVYYNVLHSVSLFRNPFQVT